jgi:hypothetical protein
LFNVQFVRPYGGDIWKIKGMQKAEWRLGPKSISNGAQYVTPDSTIYCEKFKMCRFSSGNCLFCTKFMQLAVVGKRRNTVLHLQKECNKLDLTAAQYFWLVDHNDWSRWFAISSPHICAVPGTVFIGGVAKNKTAKLKHLILLSRVTYWAPVELLLETNKSTLVCEPSPTYLATRVPTWINLVLCP